MRVRFKPTKEQRTALLAQLTRIQDPATALEILRPVLPPAFTATRVECTLESRSPDRFVLRARVWSAAGEERAYALKAYADEFVERVWDYARSLAQFDRPPHDGVCLPVEYVRHERMLVFPWVDGAYLSEIADQRKPELLVRAARIAAELHAVPLEPEPPTTAAMFVEETRARCDRLQNRWPETAPLVRPLMTALEEAATRLDPAEPAPIHGDLACGQFLWTGDRLALLDLDMFGYADPAYDVGHFLAQLERRCLLDLDPAVRAQAGPWVTAFHDAYLAARPRASRRNVAFYRGMTMIRKIYTLCRRQPVEGPALAPQLAARAHEALRDLSASEICA